MYGPELTFQLCDNSCWYGFASVDFFHKKGHSIGLSTPTKVSLLPVGLGLKYFMPLCDEWADFYIGLGFQPVHVRTRALSAFVPQQNKWALGGIAKVGAYIDLSCNFVLDLFIDYSFAEVSSHVTQAPQGFSAPKIQHWRCYFWCRSGVSFLIFAMICGAC